MISKFRLRFFSLNFRAQIPASFRALFSRRRAALAVRSLGHRLVVGVLAVALMLGTAVLHTRAVYAADAAYESGPVRPSRNPVSGENFQGGVDPSAFDQNNNPASNPEGQAEGFLESAKDKVKDVLPGASPDNKELSDQTAADVKTQKNPTLKRYGADAQ